MGYLFSFISSIFFTLYIILKKFTKQKHRSYTVFVGLGFFICAVSVFLAMKIFLKISEPWFDMRLLLACLGGILWAIALALLMASIDRIGVARAGQYKNLQAPLGSLLILFVLAEYKQMNLFLIIVAIVLTFLGAICYSVHEGNGKLNKIGIFMAAGSAICYSLNSLVRRMVTEWGFVYSQQAYTSFAIVLCLVIFMFIGKRRENDNFFNKDNYIGLGAGISYFLASITLTLSYTYIVGTVAFTISQLCTVWITLFGVFVFKEISFKKHWARIFIGLIFSTTGLVLLTFA